MQQASGSAPRTIPSPSSSPPQVWFHNESLRHIRAALQAHFAQDLPLTVLGEPDDWDDCWNFDCDTRRQQITLRIKNRPPGQNMSNQYTLPYKTSPGITQTELEQEFVRQLNIPADKIKWFRIKTGALAGQGNGMCLLIGRREDVMRLADQSDFSGTAEVFMAIALPVDGDEKSWNSLAFELLKEEHAKRVRVQQEKKREEEEQGAGGNSERDEAAASSASTSQTEPLPDLPSRAEDIYQEGHLEAVIRLRLTDTHALCNRGLYFYCPVAAPNRWTPQWRLNMLGGKRALAETSLLCAAREVREEIGLDLIGLRSDPQNHIDWFRTVPSGRCGHNTFQCVYMMGEPYPLKLDGRSLPPLPPNYGGCSSQSQAQAQRQHNNNNSGFNQRQFGGNSSCQYRTMQPGGPNNPYSGDRGDRQYSQGHRDGSAHSYSPYSSSSSSSGHSSSSRPPPYSSSHSSSSRPPLPPASSPYSHPGHRAPSSSPPPSSSHSSYPFASASSSSSSSAPSSYPFASSCTPTHSLKRKQMDDTASSTFSQPQSQAPPKRSPSTASSSSPSPYSYSYTSSRPGARPSPYAKTSAAPSPYAKTAPR